MSYFEGQRCLVTGGASFIGSHLVDALIEQGAKVFVIDNLSSGKSENLEDHTQVTVMPIDLLKLQDTERAFSEIAPDMVFHLACVHGGRGFTEHYNSSMGVNFAMDQNVIRCSQEVGAKMFYASSGCVYPMYLQSPDMDPELPFFIPFNADSCKMEGQFNSNGYIKLAEDMLGPPYDPDGLYGHAKLVGELTLRALAESGKMKSSIARFFTVYGPRGLENHAVIAMIARAFIGQDPYIVWGDGTQVRNWTHVKDIVRGILLMMEKIDDGTAINLGTEEATTVEQCAEIALTYFDRGKIKIEYDTTKPIGPLRRVADRTLARRLLGWSPEFTFYTGFLDTAKWYSKKDPDKVRRILEAGGDIERKVII